jgi:hypothetical protein
MALAACPSKDEERSARIAVKRLTGAPKSKLPQEMQRVVALGAFVLPDIEQEIHATPAAGRLRLVEAVRRIQSPEGLHLLDFLAQWDTDDTVRRRASLAAAAIRSRNKTK